MCNELEIIINEEKLDGTITIMTGNGDEIAKGLLLEPGKALEHAINEALDIIRSKNLITATLTKYTKADNRVNELYLQFSVLPTGVYGIIASSYDVYDVNDYGFRKLPIERNYVEYFRTDEPTFIPTTLEDLMALAMEHPKMFLKITEH